MIVKDSWRRILAHPAVAGAVVYLVVQLIWRGPNGIWSGKSWGRWVDQLHYYDSTLAFAHGSLTSEAHWYPLLYPLFAVPMLPLLPHNPYALLDLLCVAATATAAARIGRLIGIHAGVAVALFLATLVLPELLKSWFQPWTSTLSTALIWWLIALAGETIVDRATAVSARRLMAIAGLAVLIPMARPADLVVPLLIVAGLGITLLLDRRLNWRATIAGVALAALLAAGYGALHFAIYGPMPSAYMKLSGAIGLEFGDLPFKLVTLFIDPAPWFPGDFALLRRQPWVALGIAGLILALLAAAPRQRVFAAIVGVAMAAYVAMLAAYVDLLPTGLWRYNNIHYFKWMLPLLAMYGWYLLVQGWRRRMPAVAAMAAMIGLTGFHYVAQPAAAGEPARRIDFAPPTGIDWTQVYFATSAMREGGAMRRNIYGYRQVLTGPVIRAVALRGDFAADAQWQPDARALSWPLGTPGLGSNPPLIAPPADPIARWTARLAWSPLWWLRAPLDRHAPPR